MMSTLMDPENAVHGFSIRIFLLKLPLYTVELWSLFMLQLPLYTFLYTIIMVIISVKVTFVY
ncbi:hypothetical protein CI610_03520 [invertebrate metagenome]|uniref:Uncharacterized protein n=1 Tax=invertebrate metagenome TaxID=1711999 RepID=A0A2H9T2V0_9ZZZZ